MWTDYGLGLRVQGSIVSGELKHAIGRDFPRWAWKFKQWMANSMGRDAQLVYQSRIYHHGARYPPARLQKIALLVCESAGSKLHQATLLWSDHDLTYMLRLVLLLFCLAEHGNDPNSPIRHRQRCTRSSNATLPSRAAPNNMPSAALTTPCILHR